MIKATLLFLWLNEAHRIVSYRGEHFPSGTLKVHENISLYSREFFPDFFPIVLLREENCSESTRGSFTI